MSYDLRIAFHGLCLWVPTDGQMNVLLPKVDHHLRKMSADEGHLDGVDFRGTLWCEDVPNLRIKLPSGSPYDPTLPPHDVLADLDMVEPGRRVPKGMLRGSIPADLGAHFILTSGTCTGVAPGGLWAFSDGEGQDYYQGRFTWRVDWTIRGIEGSALDLGGHRLFPLGGVINIDVHNNPAESTGRNDRHFHHLAKLCANKSHLPSPHLRDEKIDICPSTSVAGETITPDWMVGRPLTCFGGRASPE